MIWLKTATLLFGFFGAQSTTLSETVVPGTMADCVKYLDHLQTHPDSTSEKDPAKITRLSETAILQESSMGMSTVMTIRSCVEVK